MQATRFGPSEVLVASDAPDPVAGAAARSLIHERDLAAVAARALTGDGPRGEARPDRPETLTQFEQARTIG